MGNEQSVPTPQRSPNKLSKPRTNSTANLLNLQSPAVAERELPQSDSSSPRKSRYSLFTDGSHGDTGDDKKEGTRWKRRGLFRSRSSQARNRELEIDATVIAEFTDPSSVERPVRRHSIISSQSYGPGMSELATQRQVFNFFVVDRLSGLKGDIKDFCLNGALTVRPTFNSRMSLQPVSYQQHNPRLSLVAEVQSSPFEVPESTNSQSSHEQEDNPQLSNPLLSSRTNSESQLYAPIRRKSLQQHGVATRTSFVESDPRGLLPSQTQKPELKSHDRVSLQPRSSPLSDLSAFNPQIPSSLPCQRVHTPNDLDYGHLGVYKLGSLRITNGSTSPAPSDKRPVKDRADNDYVTMGGRIAESRPRSRFGPRSYTTQTATDIIRPPWVTGAEPPLRQTLEREKQESLSSKTHILDPSLALFDFRNKHSPTKSLELAKEYMEDLSMIPYSFEASPSVSPKLEATSKHMAVEDDLFAEEPSTPPDAIRTVPRSYDSGYGTAEDPMVYAPRSKPLAKADNGYISKLPVRSFKKDTGPLVAKNLTNSIREPGSRVASSTYSVASTHETSVQERPLPVLPAQPPPPPREATLPPVPSKRQTVPTNHTLGSALLQRLDSRTTASPPSHVRQQSLPALPTATQEPQKDSPNYPDIPANSASRWPGNRIHKPQPRSQVAKIESIFTVQAAHNPIEASAIPAVSAETERKLGERVDGFPVVCFPNVLISNVTLRRTTSKETLGTIFSVGSAEVRDEINFARLQRKLPPIPASIPEYPAPKPVPKQGPRPEANRRATFQASSTSSLPFWKSFDSRRKSFRGKSRDPATGQPSVESESGSESREPVNPQVYEKHEFSGKLRYPSLTQGRQEVEEVAHRGFPRKSIEQKQDDYETHITSFEAISSSLGKSPYAIAGITARPESSGAGVRAKSFTSQLESDAAARFQRNRVVSINSQASTILQGRRSYDSIAAGNPYASMSPTTTSSRKSSRELPPSSHTNDQNSWKPVQPQMPVGMLYAVEAAQQEVVPHFSTPSWEWKPKVQLPISTSTQHKMVPTYASSQVVDHPSSTPGIADGRTRSQPPTNRLAEKEVLDPWASQKNFWRERCKSAGEALYTKNNLPSSQPKSARQSMELKHQASMSQAMKNRCLSSAQLQSPLQPYNYEREQIHAQPWTGHSTGGCHSLSPQWEQQTSETYHHTYDSPQHYDHHGEPGYYEEDYYTQPDVNSISSSHDHLPQKIHAQSNSTDDMLVLDRFSGGLDYGYDVGYEVREFSGRVGGRG